MSLKDTNNEADELLKELQQNIEDDRLYWIRNDAKIRASVTSQSYDEFRDIVAAAHLKPLDKNDTRSKTKLGWNKAISGKKSENE